MLATVREGRLRPVKQFISATLYVVLAFILLPPLAVQAHAGGAPLFTDEAAGPYRLFGWIQPQPLRAGEVHLDLAITLAPPPNAPSTALTEPVTDAMVNVTFTQQGQPGSVVVGVAKPGEALNAFYYELGVRLNHAGIWHIVVEVTGAAGVGSLEVWQEVLPARQVHWPLIAGVGAALVLLIGLVGLWNRFQAKE